MSKINFKDLDGWLKVAAIGAIIYSIDTFLILAVAIFDLLFGIFT